MEPSKNIHIDMDAFYASVEIRDNPRLRGLPVIVGGDPHSRGVVSTCSYEARAYGVHSGMASSRAVRLCPQAIFLRPRFDAYQEASRIIHEIFHDYTDHVEPLSLDEAYLDVTENFHGIPFAMWIAREIKRRIQVETGGLTPPQNLLQYVPGENCLGHAKTRWILRNSTASGGTIPRKVASR